MWHRWPTATSPPLVVHGIQLPSTAIPSYRGLNRWCFRGFGFKPRPQLHVAVMQSFVRSCRARLLQPPSRCFTTRIQSSLIPQSPTFTSKTLHLPTIHIPFGCDDADGAFRDMPMMRDTTMMPKRFPLVCLLLPPVCFLSHHVAYVVLHQTDYTTTDAG